MALGDCILYAFTKKCPRDFGYGLDAFWMRGA